jgi:hypothetical protein
MNRAPLAIIFVTLSAIFAGCGWYFGAMSQPNDSSADAHSEPYRHWEYVHDQTRNKLEFDFADGEQTKFKAICDEKAEFYLSGGSYSEPPHNFILEVDSRSWAIPIYSSVHGRGLFVDNREAANAIKMAQKAIIFRVGSWARHITPGPELTFFVRQCGAIRARDPEAIGAGSDF